MLFNYFLSMPNSERTKHNRSFRNKLPNKRYVLNYTHGAEVTDKRRKKISRKTKSKKYKTEISKKNKLNLSPVNFGDFFFLVKNFILRRVKIQSKIGCLSTSRYPYIQICQTSPQKTFIIIFCQFKNTTRVSHTRVDNFRPTKKKINSLPTKKIIKQKFEKKTPIIMTTLRYKRESKNFSIEIYFVFDEQNHTLRSLQCTIVD